MRRRSGFAWLLMVFAATASAQDLDSSGRTFAFTFLENPFGGEMERTDLLFTGDVRTTVTVEYPANEPEVVETVTVVPGTVTTVSLPLDALTDWTPDGVNDSVAWIQAEEEVALVGINYRFSSADASLALPVEVWNTEYVVADYDPSFGPSQLAVQAAWNDTVVTITPAVQLVGRPAGVPFQVTLDRGEVYQGESLLQSGPGGSLTGTLVSADRPVGVVHGSGCPVIPVGSVACDHAFEVARPVQSWGTTALVSNFPQRGSGSIYRVLAAEDATTVQLDGAVVATLAAGEYTQIGPIPGNHALTADRPIQVVQYMTGVIDLDLDLNGDPAMLVVTPVEQYRSSHTFVRAEPTFFSSQWVTIIAADSDVGTLTLDGVVVPPGAFQPIAGTGFSAARRGLGAGAHRTESASGHTALAYSMGPGVSWLHAAGAGCDFVNPAGDPTSPLCEVTAAPSGTTASGTASDPGTGASGVFFVSLDEGASNLALAVEPFVPGDATVPFVVHLIDVVQAGTGTVRVMDGSGNVGTCDVSLAGAECYLVLGSGPGESVFATGGHEFLTQVAEIRHFLAVTLALPAEVPCPDVPVPVGRTALTDASDGASWDFAVQLLMWNPIDFPAQPEQFSAGLLVDVTPDGRIRTRSFGSGTGIEVAAELVRDAAGRAVIRFPFTIPGF